VIHTGSHAYVYKYTHIQEEEQCDGKSDWETKELKKATPG
jgi:hypothetical protein